MLGLLIRWGRLAGCLRSSVSRRTEVSPLRWLLEGRATLWYLGGRRLASAAQPTLRVPTERCCAHVRGLAVAFLG